jgi:hypothetical protein
VRIRIRATRTVRRDGMGFLQRDADGGRLCTPP